MFQILRRFMDQVSGDGTAGGAGAPAAGVVAPGAAGVVAPGAAAPAAGAEWYKDFQDPSVKDWMKSLGNAYPNAESLALKALNLEKFMGAEKANRGFVMPGANAKPEEWVALWKKMGAPEKPEGYKLPDGLDKDPFITGLRAQAHKMGMPPQLFDGVMNFVVEQAKGKHEADLNAFSAETEKQLNEVKQAWGAEYDAKVELSRRAAQTLVPHANKEELQEILNKMEGALGTKLTMELWANIGAGMGEHEFIQGETPSGEGGMTPEGARIKINALKQDKEWVKAWQAGDVEKKAEWSKLHRIGYPEQAQ